MKRVVLPDSATALLLALLLTLLAVIASFTPPAVQRVVTEALIYVVIVVGLYVFVGGSGVISFGHTAFVAIGGYSSAMLTLSPQKKHILLSLPPVLEHLHVPMGVSLLFASSVAGVAAVAIGWPIMRLRGVVPSMATFALLMIAHAVALNWKAVTGGRQALVGIPLDTTLWVALAGAIVSICIAAWHQQSTRGFLLRCSRESDVAAESIGINIVGERMLAFSLSACVCALGGALFVHFLGTLNANTFFLDTTFLSLAMLVVGGYRSLTGAVTGVLVLSLVAEVFRIIEQGGTVFGKEIPPILGLEEVALGLIMLFILLRRPNGICGGFEIGRVLRRTRS